MTLLDHYRRLPLRVKLSLWVSAGVSAIVVALMLALLGELQSSSRHSVTQVQAALVDGVARELDSKVGMRRDALLKGGAALGERLPIVGGAAIDEFFASHGMMVSAFDTLLLADPDGRIVYDTTGSPTGARPPIADRPYFREALETGRLVVSPPLVAKLTAAPIITFAAPVRDARGRTTGVLVGLLRLDRPNFVSEVGKLRIGDGGYFVMRTLGDAPVVIAHARAERVLTRDGSTSTGSTSAGSTSAGSTSTGSTSAGSTSAGPTSAGSTSASPPVRGATPASPAVVAGGGPAGAVTVTGLDAEGTPALLTRRQLASAPWQLEAVYPTAEAFAGLRHRQRQVLAIGVAIAVISWLLVGWLTARLLAPMDKLRQALQLDATGSDELLHAIRADSTDMAALLEAYYAQKARRLATETALAASERRLREIADHLPALVAYVDKHRVYHFANAHYRTLLGMEPDDMVGRTVLEAAGEKVHASVDRHIAAVLQGKPQTFERNVDEAQGGHSLIVTYVPDVDAAGEVVGYYAMSLDMTQRKKAEQQLARSERRLKAITDSVPALIAVVDRKERYRFANARFRTVMGVEPEALIGQSMAEFLGPVAYAELLPEMEAAMRGEHRRFERTGWKHNAETHFLVEYVPETETDGELAGFVVMVLDITERKRMELALAQSERRMRTITDNLPALILHYDRDLRYTFANAKSGEAFGFDPAAVMGRSLLEVRGERVHGELAPRMFSALAGQKVSFETTTWAGDGSAHWYQCNYVPEFDAAGNVLGFYALTFDITRRKHDEAQLRASEQLLDRMGRIAGVGGWAVEFGSGEVSWTGETRRIHEVADDYRPTLEGAIEFYAGEGRPAIEQAVQRATETGAPWDLVLPLRTAQGREIWVRATGEVEFENGRAARMFGAFQDVSQRVEAERQLREQAELLQVTLQSIGDGVITADERGHVRWMNPAAERMTGWTSEAACGRPTPEVFRILHAETRAPAQDPVELCLATLGPAGLPDRTVLISVSGQEFAIEDSASPIHDARGGLRGAVLVFHDVSEQRRMTDQMTHRATHDALTGLVNRAEFDVRLRRVWSRACEEGVHNALMFIDLDQFKLVNDACGHAMGDKLLCQVSELLRASVRHRDTLARLGGDEFGVLLEHCTVEQAQRVAQSICDRMEDFRFIHDGRRFRIGTSIGLVPVDARWRDTEAMQKAADTACYAAKEAGRNRVHVWFDTDELLHAREGDTQWGSRLEEALDDHDFVLYAQQLQPLAAPTAGLHCEVLIRLREADGTIVAPGRFLPAAERFHMASRIDRWVVRRVFEWLAEQGGSPPDIETIAINLSGQSIGDRAFHRHVVQLLRELPIDSTKICFEVTETSAITNLVDASAFIREMREIGMRVALDDFGAGASSFGYLKNLQVDYLKIDGQFIRNIETDPLDMAAVRCFHEVARAIGVQTIAEFVETASVREVLTDIGIDFAQGYLIHRPEPLDELVGRTRQGRGLTALSLPA